MFRNRWIYAPSPNDPISTGGGGGNLAPASGSAAGQPGAGTPSPAPGSSAPQYVTMEAIQGFGSGLVDALAKSAQEHEARLDARFNQWSQRVSAAPGQGSQPTPARSPSSDPNEPSDLLVALAKGDLSAVDRRVVDQLHSTGVVGWLGRQATNAANANDAAAKAAVDSEFGEGTWEKVLKPAVDRTLGESVAARADPQTFHHALAAAKGQHFGELTTRATAKAKAAEEARAAAEAAERARYSSPWMPGNGYPPSAGAALDSEDTALLAKISAKTRGDVPKPEEAAKLRDLVMSKGTRGVSFEDMATIFGK